MKTLPYILLLALAACSGEQQTTSNEKTLPKGIWRMELDLGDGLRLPFLFDLVESGGVYSADIINGSEKIRTEAFLVSNDSVKFRLPVFDSEFKMKRDGDRKLSGAWFNYSKGSDYRLAAKAEFGNKERFEQGASNPANYNGKWKTVFSEGKDNQYYAVGLFEQNGDIVTGTFLTETGDYRFLEGRVNDKRIQLSCFDGSHAFLFDGSINNEGVINGMFHSGNHWKETWSAVRNDTFELSDPESLTFIKDGYTGLEFSFPDVDNKTVSFPSEEYKNKVVIVELMGSWCPNCMDETNYLKGLYGAYKNKGLEIISLCYERTDDFETSARNVKKHKEHLGAEWRFLIAGSAQKDKAASTLPMLNHVMSFPTTIFIDKKGEVRKIYTGFYGPGTGQYHERYAEMNQSFLEKLLSE
jgi:thiol-disulfide isomerase/thioredoxin